MNIARSFLSSISSLIDDKDASIWARSWSEKSGQSIPGVSNSSKVSFILIQLKLLVTPGIFPDLVIFLNAPYDLIKTLRKERKNERYEY